MIANAQLAFIAKCECEFSKLNDNRNASNEHHQFYNWIVGNRKFLLTLIFENGLGNSLDLWTGMIVDRPMINSLSSLKFVTLLPQG